MITLGTIYIPPTLAARAVLGWTNLQDLRLIAQVYQPIFEGTNPVLVGHSAVAAPTTVPVTFTLVDFRVQIYLPGPVLLKNVTLSTINYNQLRFYPTRYDINGQLPDEYLCMFPMTMDATVSNKHLSFSFPNNMLLEV